ncbi:DUF4129 domain-containing protein [Lewinella sp. IMCC34183]|uniref:DUF4129 domain-containing protein n=1 Tax=Lewinella sp. IMCC34183 TaxID=2248762 RepID=UPI000E275C6E|nr:DUF4129 domain-containing protein [Lewinella sp. IMCC34183]
MIISRRILLLAALLFVVGLLPGQGSGVFPEQRLGELREEIHFERPAAPEFEPEPDRPAESFDWTLFRTPVIVVLSTVLVAGLAYLLYRMRRDLTAGSSPRRAEPAPAVDATAIQDEVIVERGVAPGLVERAEAAGQYDVAVRLLYLGVLNTLQGAGLLRYRRDFSNRDYRRQLAGSPQAAAFRTVTEAYERYWYGGYPLDRLSYRVVRTEVAALYALLPAPAVNSPQA